MQFREQIPVFLVEDEINHASGTARYVRRILIWLVELKSGMIYSRDLQLLMRTDPHMFICDVRSAINCKQLYDKTLDL